MKKYEKESFLKGFILFFTTLLILNAIIFYLYYDEQKDYTKQDIFNEIKIFNYTFKDKDILIKIVPIKKNSQLYLLHVNKNEIFAYFDIPSSSNNSLKIIYPYSKYDKLLNNLAKKCFIYFLITSIFLLFLAGILSLYSIRPLRNAIQLLDEFLKDIIHDLNTPIASILLNLQILKHKQSEKALKRIEFSAKNIGTLYNNLEALIKENELHVDKVDLKTMILEKIEYYQYLYPNISFETNLKCEDINSSYDELSRILDNLISNACKYNKEDGKVIIETNINSITIEDTGVGIKNCKKVFERFYKESERGIGLGMNIVKKLCDKLEYKIDIKSKLDIGTKIEVTFK